MIYIQRCLRCLRCQPKVLLVPYSSSFQDLEKTLASVDAATRQTVIAEVRRVRDELSALQWHHKKFEERTLADKLQAEVNRATLLAECEQAKARLVYFFLFLFSISTFEEKKIISSCVSVCLFLFFFVVIVV
jgi:hypothetical protein